MYAATDPEPPPERRGHDGAHDAADGARAEREAEHARLDARGISSRTG